MIRATLMECNCSDTDIDIVCDVRSSVDEWSMDATDSSMGVLMWLDGMQLQ